MKQAERLRQVGIGVQLKNLRKKSGMTTRSVASALGLSPASVNRNEQGQRVPDREEASALCALYGVTGDEKRELIERIGETSETASWLATGHLPDQLASLMVLEREAVAITDAQVALIPGLVQTADYARLVLGSPAVIDEDVERRVSTRLGRQAILSRPNAPEVSLFIDEGVLHRSLGDAWVMRRQLEHLLVVQQRDNVSVRVLPFDTAGHPAVDGSFSRYELVDGSPYIFVEGLSFGVFITEPTEVKPFVEVCRVLDDRALDEQGSNKMIKEIAERYGDE
ncbi:transcriptional regulator with XRE-family HTH domain [Saccharopolyspora lacisalsi]|uniref:Transcriptional regulator with XRE-family HTH domain n=1 Tax=Halosaccharopolyspora lacisalsi TaxID=1000566 RepID=A0A839DP98_9PSEU|nr:helix-turn-helix transcriptional regulator [Halosaccharopolyspora lacisalsi]MBA8822820.1 transcriptional regulator with XRE-family HTH domain [Halosaccharopolyspora lacisalsi]